MAPLATDNESVNKCQSNCLQQTCSLCCWLLKVSRWVEKLVVEEEIPPLSTR